jgi:hypothetical protein
MNPIKSFFRWLFNINKEVTFPISEELIERDSIVRELSKKIQSQEAQLSKIKAEDNLKKQLSKEEESKKEIIEDLIRQNEQKRMELFKDATSLEKIYKKLSNPKFKREIELSDKNDKVIFGNFHDIVILSNGFLGIQDTEGRVIAYGPTLRHIIYKPESIANQFRRKRILLPCNENGIFFPDIEEQEMPECIYDDETGNIKWATIRTKPLRQMIEEREKKIRSDAQYIEKIEQDKIDLVKKNRDLERALRLESNSSETAQTELSKAMDKSIQFERRIGDLQMRVIRLQEMKNINDTMVQSLENINSNLLEKAEEMGVKEEFRKALDMVQKLISWSKSVVPEKVYVTEEKPQMEVKK